MANMKKKLWLIVLLVNILIRPGAWAAGSFYVKKIQVEGLQRINPETVYSYLPIHQGQTLRPSQTGEVIGALYRTGFFDHISLARSGNTLIIKVIERPTIGQLKISGNSAISKEKLTTVMRSVDVAEGRVYNRAVLEKIKQSLLNQYYELGKYNARVDVTVSQMERNRVLVNIEISEGVVTKVRNINIIGNHAFSEFRLRKQLELTTPGLLTIITQSDRYSQEKLDASLDALRNFYLDHGYLKFAVKSSQVAMTPDRKSIYLTIVVDEGDKYTIKGYDLKGDLVVPREELTKLIEIEPGDTFSRQAIIKAEKSISDALGDKGYIGAVVTLEPQIDDKKKEVFLTFNVKPGKRTYVRHVFFSDNTRTNDDVLRREVQQMESSVASTSKLELSKQKLSQLAYIKNVEMNVTPVQEHDDQVDVNYKVTEDSAAQANFSIGYSQVDGIILGAGLNQKNFMGTGKTVGLNISESKVQDYLGASFTDPYYTPDGVSRSINLSATRYNPLKASVSRSYTTDQYDFSVVYGIPIFQEKSAIDRLQLGWGLEDTLVNTHTRYPTSLQVQDFINHHGRHFEQGYLIGGVSRDGRDKVIFPTQGSLNTLGFDVYLPATGHSLKYYTVAYNGKWYQPLTKSFIVSAKGQFAYGNGFAGPKDYPFFKDYYAGGIGSVNGFEGNTLGPRDSNNDPTGGNLLATAQLALIFPNYISENLRTLVFIDGGNVYNTFDNRSLGGTATGGPRYGAGIEADWLTPLGLVDVSVTKPLNSKRGDFERIIQFSLGANFG